MSLDDAGAFLGARDVLVFRRVGLRWTHLGGLGRGASWAGNVEVQGGLDPRLDTALAQGRPVRRHGRRPHHVVGPYWAVTSAVVRVDAHHAVVLGSPDATPQLLRADDAELVDVAARAVAEVTSVSPARHLADELEVLTALRELTTTAPATVDALLQHLAHAVVDALGCDLAALWLDDRQHAVVHAGWAPRGGPQRAVVAARQLVPHLGSAAGGPDWIVVQDAAERPLPEPIGPDPEVASYLALPLDVDGQRGCLLVVHAAVAARGFTTLCQSLALQLAQAGCRLLETAATHDELVRQLDSSREHAVLDPLTGAANRRGWDEAVGRAREHVASGGTVTVVTVDLDDLKRVNDTHGHNAGDELIIECAQALRRCVRGQPDVIARLGGDEFALLLRGHEVDAVEIADRLRSSLERTLTARGLPLRTSVGAARCAPRSSLDDAVRRADVAMYRDKRARRRAG
jgi:diguanylate cyclase (GGDEF)-like protein